MNKCSISFLLIIFIFANHLMAQDVDSIVVEISDGIVVESIDTVSVESLNSISVENPDTVFAETPDTLAGARMDTVSDEIPDVVYVNAFAVNVRSGPALDYDKVGVVSLNTKLKVISESEQWYEILIGDSLDGWITSRFTRLTPISGAERNRIIYQDGDFQSKIHLIRRLSREHSGHGFNLLKDIVIAHDKYDYGIEYDRILLPEIFKGWAENEIVEAMNILIYVMEQDLKGEIGKSLEAVREIKLAAKEAIKKLVKL
ncbi:MAG: SH3 domain-containing protein [candidate division Zixibacteria bacterium]|nr:SH3 domain-containing protein [Candidatus Tariuqbacter arcticus]